MKTPGKQAASITDFAVSSVICFVHMRLGMQMALSNVMVLLPLHTACSGTFAVFSGDSEDIDCNKLRLSYVAHIVSGI